MIRDQINSIKALLGERTSSPLFGSFIISWILWNHRFIAVLFSNLPIIESFRFIDTQLYPEWWHWPTYGLIYPLLTSAVYIFAYPYPARFVYRFWAFRQKELKELRAKIEDETPLTIAESRKIKSEHREMQLEFENTLTTKNLEVQRLTELLERERELNELGERERRDAEPVFQPAGNSAGQGQANIKFKNRGALVNNVEVIVNPPVQGSSHPSIWGQDDELVVNLRGLDVSKGETPFTIAYVDRRGRRGRKEYIWDPNSGSAKPN